MSKGKKKKQGDEFSIKMINFAPLLQPCDGELSKF